jgi:quercetin dioxygenase-like cupin family protein
VDVSKSTPPGRIVLRQADQGTPIGEVAVVKAGGHDGEGNLTLLQYQAPPGFGSPLHIHLDADEAWFILEGQLTYYSGDWTAEATAGAFILVPRGTPHRYTVTGKTQARFLELFTVGGKEEFFLDIGARRAQSGGQRLPFSEAEAVYRKHNITLLAEP